ncbi:MAG: hypothetical protein KDK39_12675 [Leptospiraceae bacterium]|nr:hypothetical protein [Leptospiraceae bacterium]
MNGSYDSIFVSGFFVDFDKNRRWSVLRCGSPGPTRRHVHGDQVQINPGTTFS